MVSYREIIRLKSLGYSNTHTASSCGSSRNTVSDVWRIAQEKSLTWPIPDTLTDLEIGQILYPDKKWQSNRKIPDFEHMHQEMARPGVTLTLLWAEYNEQCAEEGSIPYQHSQFCEKYRAYVMSKKATLRIKHKPGELMEVDWAGDTLTVTDAMTGEKIDAYLFVASLPCSLYSYAEAFPDMKSGHWIEAHVHAFNFFGGCTRILTPDNTKTGIIKNTRTELIYNRSYHEMAEYYGAAIIPARPVRPKDKGTVEGEVGHLETWVIAALRNRTFFSFSELNRAVLEKLNEFNERPFQKKKGSRSSAFKEEEKEYLMPLPASPYETAIWKQMTVQLDYLISDGECNKYSVPYTYIGKKVEVRITEKSIEAFYRGQRIASHVRVPYSKDPIYNLDHMPENHRRYQAYNTENFLEWAEGIGSSTLVVTKHFLYQHKVEKQGYKSCASLMRLADRYSSERLEKACERALSYTPEPSLKNITTILKNGQDQINKGDHKNITVSKSKGITRGADYFKGGDHE